MKSPHVNEYTGKRGESAKKGRKKIVWSKGTNPWALCSKTWELTRWKLKLVLALTVSSTLSFWGAGRGVEWWCHYNLNTWYDAFLRQKWSRLYFNAAQEVFENIEIWFSNIDAVIAHSFALDLRVLETFFTEIQPSLCLQTQETSKTKHFFVVVMYCSGVVDDSDGQLISAERWCLLKKKKIR